MMVSALSSLLVTGAGFFVPVSAAVARVSLVDYFMGLLKV
ncbi:hypothetical protein LINGRAHAP2_LOCUS32284 [Linum grandiflorum]